MATAEFAFNNKVHIATKMSLFKVNYGREPRIGFDIRKKEKNEKAEEFVREMKERHEEARAALVKAQEEMKRQADRNRKKAEEYRVGVSYTSPLVWKYIPVVESPPNHTSPSSMVATFLTTRLMAVLQPSGYSVFHGRDTPIQLSLL